MSNYAEVGVWKGGGVGRIMQFMQPEDQLFLFDSFEGHREPCSLDDAEAHHQGRYADTSIDEVQSRFPKAVVVAGWIPDTLGPFVDFKFKFVRIDLDQYLPTLYACTFFKSRMESGGVIEFDDYEHPECPGAKLAIDEVFGQENVGGIPLHWRAP